jgi:hypothetical protein
MLLCLLSEDEERLGWREEHREGRVQETRPCKQGGLEMRLVLNSILIVNIKYI